MPEHPAARRLVDAVQQPADRVPLLGAVGAHEERAGDSRQPARPEIERVHARKEHAHRRIERDGEERRDRHRQILGPRQGAEEAPFLIHQSKDRQERDGNHQQREEDRRPHLEQRLQAHLVEIALAPSGLPELQLVVGIFDFDDRAVDKHAHGDGDAGERHEVGVESHRVERNER